MCGGGGGMPVVYNQNGYKGVEAVIDKDLVAAMLAEQIGADHLMILTDADAVYQHWGTPQQKALRDVTISQLRPFATPDGAMGLKPRRLFSSLSVQAKWHLLVPFRTSRKYWLEKKAHVSGLPVHMPLPKH